MHEAGHSKAVVWENSEGWGGEGGGRRVHNEGTNVHLWLIHVDVWQNHHNVVSNYPPIKLINLKKLKILVAAESYLLAAQDKPHQFPAYQTCCLLTWRVCLFLRSLLALVYRG